MARRKVRHYNGREYYNDLLNKYFEEHKTELLDWLVVRMGYGSLRELRNEEMTGMWFDCGWVKLEPRNKDQAHEWKLDSEYGSTYLYLEPSCYPTQSTTIKELLVRRALRELGLLNEFYVIVTLD